MRRKWKKGKLYRLYSVTFSFGGIYQMTNGSFIHYMAIPKLMTMPTISEIESALEKSGYDTARPVVSAISLLGEFRRDDLPESGCVIIERIVPERENRLSSDINTDSGPIMIRMDWIV